MRQDVDHLLRGRRAPRIRRQLHIFRRQVRPQVEQPIRKNHQRVARLERRPPHQELGVGKDSDRRAALGEQLLAGGATQQPRMAVSRVDILDAPRPRVELAVEHSHVRVIDLESRRHDAGGLLDAGLERFDLGRATQRRARGGHHQRRGQALAHHVPQGDGEPSVRCAIPVVEIAADLAGRGEVGRDLEPILFQR